MLFQLCIRKNVKFACTESVQYYIIKICAKMTLFLRSSLTYSGLIFLFLCHGEYFPNSFLIFVQMQV